MTANPNQANLRVVIYVRISKDQALHEQKTGDKKSNREEAAGVRRQEDACRELAEKRGWEVVEVYVDNDLSAFGNKPRPAYERMLADMRAGKVGAVIAWHTDRLTRKLSELETLMQVAEDQKVVFATVQAGELDLSTAAGRLVARLMGAVARHEAELKGERQSAQLKQLAYAGKARGGGSRPFGYIDAARTAVDPVEAAVIRKLAQMAIDGESRGRMASWLGEQGVKTVGGGDWYPPVVKRMLVNPALAGLSVWKGEVVGKGSWEPILDEETHSQVVDALSYVGPGRKNRGAKTAWLQGIIWCRCGYPLVTAQTKRRKEDPYTRIYSCRTRYMQGRPGWQKACGKISVKADSIEDDIAEQIIARLAMPKSREAFDKTTTLREPVGDPGVELEKIATQLGELGTDYADGLVDRASFLAATKRLKDRRQMLLDATLPRKRPDLPYGSIEKLAAWWGSATFVQKRSTARALVDRIDVGPHKGRRSDYDSSRVEVLWREG